MSEESAPYGSRLEALLRYVKENGRICPKPEQWNALWEMLPSRRPLGDGWDPPLPLILGGWNTSDEEKRTRLEQHIRYAAAHKAFSKVDRYLRELGEDNWAHFDWIRSMRSPEQTTEGQSDRRAPRQEQPMPRDWTEELARLSELAEGVTVLVASIQSHLWETAAASDAVPASVPEPLGSMLTALADRLHGLQRVALGMRTRCVTDVLYKFAAARPLTRDEYYLVRSMGIDFGTAYYHGLAPLDDFELFQMLRVETDRELFYINIAERPREQIDRVWARFGRPPEEVAEEWLRPEQRTFFRRYLLLLCH